MRTCIAEPDCRAGKMERIQQKVWIGYLLGRSCPLFEPYINQVLVYKCTCLASGTETESESPSRLRAVQLLRRGGSGRLLEAGGVRAEPPANGGRGKRKYAQQHRLTHELHVFDFSPRLRVVWPVLFSGRLAGTQIAQVVRRGCD